MSLLTPFLNTNLSSINCKPSISTVNNVSSQVWHNGLGHLSCKRLEVLKDKLQFTCNDLLDNRCWTVFP